MDTLKAVSAPPNQSSRLVQAPPTKDEQFGVSASAVATAAVPAKLAEQIDPENKQQISNAVKEINSFFQLAQRSLGFSIDESSGHMVMQIRDAETNELIRQIPGADALKLAKQLDDLTGILFKAQA
ncbi:MAG: flagellar protein FlaG [Methylobacter sp.]|nr:flagellar protein FlaG [Methylobacter sp.]